jgi:hypothetical protein
MPSVSVANAATLAMGLYHCALFIVFLILKDALAFVFA